jgi:PPOX class probable F420-dependent enzyme
MSSLLDMTQERHAHIDQRLRADKIVWLISGRPNGRPHAVPVGFVWDGESFWLFSRPNNQKIKNIRANANVLLAVDDTHLGLDSITIEGTATLLATESANRTLSIYAEKYSGGLKAQGLTRESLAVQYSQCIRITPTRVV